MTQSKEDQPPNPIDDHEEEWAILDELEGRASTKPTTPRWLPPNMHPVLEELPKWSLLAEVLEEIEYEILRMEGAFGNGWYIHSAYFRSAHLGSQLKQNPPQGQTPRS